jgi:hypothetical protein
LKIFSREGFQSHRYQFSWHFHTHILTVSLEAGSFKIWKFSKSYWRVSVTRWCVNWDLQMVVSLVLNNPPHTGIWFRLSTLVSCSSEKSEASNRGTLDVNKTVGVVFFFLTPHSNVFRVPRIMAPAVGTPLSMANRVVYTADCNKENSHTADYQGRFTQYFVILYL